MKQGSREWMLFRRGKITASRFGDVLANPTTKRYQSYQDEVYDGLVGVPDFKELDKPWFEHGRENEVEARLAYMWGSGIDVYQVPYVMSPKYDYVSCSPDGLVGTEGGIEIKCRSTMKSFIANSGKLPASVKPQVQGCMWITGRKWWDYVNYYTNGILSKIDIVRVLPDADYHERLETACVKFWSEIQLMIKKGA